MAQYAGYVAKESALLGGVSAFGGHVSWTAIEGAGFMIAKGIKKDINIVDIFKFNFLIPLYLAK